MQVGCYRSRTSVGGYEADNLTLNGGPEVRTRHDLTADVDRHRDTALPSSCSLVLLLHGSAAELVPALA